MKSAELVTKDGRTVSIPELRLDPRGTWGGAIPVDLYSVQSVRLLEAAPGTSCRRRSRRAPSGLRNRADGAHLATSAGLAVRVERQFGQAVPAYRCRCVKQPPRSQCTDTEREMATGTVKWFSDDKGSGSSAG